jgi:hypothetical protein
MQARTPSNTAMTSPSKCSRDKGIFFDLTVTFAGGPVAGVEQKSAVLSPEDEQKLAQYEERLNREARGSPHTVLHRSGR